MRAFVYGNPIYRALLNRRPCPEKFLLPPGDSWPGNAAAGQKLLGVQSGLFEYESGEIRPVWNRKEILSHSWLRDLRAVGTEAAKKKALTLIEKWLAQHDSWHEESWAPGVLGERLANWIRFYDFYCATADPDFSARLISSAARQWFHLSRCLRRDLMGEEGLCAIKGIITAGLALAKNDQVIDTAVETLKRLLFAEILSDGGHISRNPYLQFQVLRHLIDIRSVMAAAKYDVPHELATAIERMVPALKLFRHGDGGLALFNGSSEGSPLEIDAALTLSGARGRVLRRLPHTGYERLTAGRSLLLVDVGTPPPRPYDRTAHAGLLSFEFSVGKERLIVNCGTGPENDSEWRMAMASTAAHSTLNLRDTNACEILPDGGIGHRPKRISAQRYEQDGAHYVEAEHNGYESKFRVIHYRALCLASEGTELHGREVLSGPPGKDFAVRWHLHPSVQASLGRGGQTALLRLPSGNGWRLRVNNSNHIGGLSLEPSVYGGGLPLRRSLQIKVSGRTQEDPAVVSWLLAREKKDE